MLRIINNNVIVRAGVNEKVLPNTLSLVSPKNLFVIEILHLRRVASLAYTPLNGCWGSE
jgi:hypothetical protein